MRLAVPFFTLAIAATASNPDAAHPAILKTEFIYESAPFPQCHASTIAETDAGLVAAWFGGTTEKHRDVGIWLSRHIEGKWTPPTEVANGNQPDGSRLPCWNPVLFQPRGAPLMLFYKVGPEPKSWWGLLRTSMDHGATWSEARRLPDGILGPIKNKPIQLRDGTILSGSSTEHDGWRLHFERSSDLGATWAATTPNHDGKKLGAIQPSILTRADGTLLAMGRTRGHGKIFTTTSNDAGITWTPPVLGSLPNPNSGTDAVTLRDGRHLLVYNHTAPVIGRWGGPRSPLNLAISDDDGATWKACLILESEPGQEFSYPAIIQTRDGLVHVTCTWKRTKVKHTILDPAKLTPREMPGGQWPAE